MITLQAKPQDRQKKEPTETVQFWSLLVFSWGLFVCLNTLLRVPLVGSPGLTLSASCLFGLAGGLATVFVCRLLDEARIAGLPSLSFAPSPRTGNWVPEGVWLVGGICLVLVGLLAVLDVQVFFGLAALEPLRSSLSDYVSAALIYGFVLGSVVLFYCCQKEKLAEQERALRALTSLARGHELRALRYQLNPHFLYNALNATSALILDRENDRADETVEHLTRFLRGTLDPRLEGFIPLRDELRLLEHYLAVEQVRFGKRLGVIFDIAPGAEEELVPGFILQPLVENAIKYAVAPFSTGGTIRISAEFHRTAEDIHLLLRVSDSGPLQSLESLSKRNAQRVPSQKARGDGEGIGLANVEDRMRHLFGDAGTVHYAVRQPNGLSVTLCLPVGLRAGDDDRPDTPQLSRRLRQTMQSALAADAS